MTFVGVEVFGSRHHIVAHSLQIEDLKKIKPLKDLREGTAKIQSGTYLYVIMLGDPEYIRLIHEDHLVHEGLGG